MKTILRLALCLSISLLFAACGDDEALPLLKYSGAELKSTQKNFSYLGSIPQSGADIEVEADDVVELNIDKVMSFYETDDGQILPVLQGEWGNITVTQDSSATKIDIHIAENTLKRERQFIIKLKKGTQLYQLILNQSYSE